MNFNIDVVIFIIFLTITLAIGLFYGRGIKTFKDYALGGRNFSTATLATALIATWISGSAFLTDVSETYKNGLFYMVPGMLSDIFSWIIICYFIAPRIGEFLGALSIADVLGNLYGNKVRFIAAISSTFNCIGKVAAQFKVSSTILQLFFGISSFYATLASSIIIIIYSAFGGIRAVTFTDIIQFATFGAIIPIIALVIWGSFDDPQVVFYTLSENPLFDYTQIFNPEHPQFWGTVSLALYFLIPSFNPAIFQRTSMAKDTVQVAEVFFFATFSRLAISILFFWIAILLLSKDPNLQPDKLFAYIIDKYAYAGLKGLIAAGVMAMVMSTADSYINAATVTLSYDIRTSFGIDYWSEKRSLIFSYICAIFIGILAFGLAFYMKGLLALFLLVSSFYLPVVTVPFLLAIFGFRTTSTAVLSGIIAGLATVIVWRSFFMDITGVDSVLPGMFANIVFLFLTHYGFKQKGGWVGIKDYTALNKIRNQRQIKLLQVVKNITTFNAIDFCQKNAPKQESTYTFFGIFCIVSVFSTMYSMPIGIRQHYTDIIQLIYHSVLIISAIFLTYPIWPQTFKNQQFISITWIICLFYVFIFVGFLQVLVSNFGQFQLMIFLLSTIILTTLTRWQITLFMLLTGVMCSVIYFKWNTGINPDNIPLGLKFKITYLLLLISGILLIVFKPKQEEQEATEAKVGGLETEVTDLNEKVFHYTERIADQEKEIERLGATAQKILNNVNHELRLPVGNVMNFAEMLADGLGKFNEKQLQMLTEEVYKNSNRLSTMILNMLDLATLNAKKLELDKKLINLGELVQDRVNSCRKIYLGEKQIDFDMQIEEDILINVDPNYIRQTVDNLVINAINFSKKGVINISVLRKGQTVEFLIKDNGIGIPREELYDIFTPFKMGSKTESKAEGRGVGLALCKAAIEAHGGSITVESDGVDGAIFKFVL